SPRAIAINGSGNSLSNAWPLSNSYNAYPWIQVELGSLCRFRVPVCLKHPLSPIPLMPSSAFPVGLWGLVAVQFQWPKEVPRRKVRDLLAQLSPMPSRSTVVHAPVDPRL